MKKYYIYDYDKQKVVKTDMGFSTKQDALSDVILKRLEKLDLYIDLVTINLALLETDISRVEKLK